MKAPASLQPATVGHGNLPSVQTGAADKEVWYVAITDFPKGLGSTTRSRSICTALRLAGRRPRLLIPYAIGHGSNEHVAGVEDGVPYEYLNGSVTRPRGAHRVALAKVRASIQLTRRLWMGRRRVSSVFLSKMSAFDAWPVLLAARALRIPVVLDMTDEWHDPSIPIRHLGFARYCYQLLSRASEGVMFRGADRILVVTRHFERRLHRHAPKLRRLTMLFDPERFERGPADRLGGLSGPSILYAGGISVIEGVHILIEAFAQLPDGPTGRASLQIVGASSHGDSIETYRSQAARLGVSDRIVFHPTLDRDRYAAALRGADVLVIPRTTGYASQAGFPYKLGEYLATGTPVVVTRFGDVEDYFTDLRDCFMSAPDDPSALASTLRYVLDHEQEARVIARCGQFRARELFSYEHGAKVLDEMLHELEGAAASTSDRAAGQLRSGRGEEQVSLVEPTVRRPRILLIATYSQALSSFVAPFARYLDEQGYDVTMSASEEELAGPSTLSTLRADGFEVVSVPFTNRPRPHRDVLSAWRLWRLLRGSPFDIVHTFTAKAGFIGRLVGRIAGVPVVVHTAFSFPHLDDPPKAWLYRPLELNATALCDHVFCISRLGYEQALSLGRSPRHGISNPGIGLDFQRFAHLVDRETARRDLGLPLQSPLVGTVARLTPHKRVDLFLKVCADVAAHRPDSVFLVLGDGPERSSLDALVVRLGLANRVRFLRYLPDSAAVVKFMRALDVFVLPTEREGFGMVFAEAMAAETPVVGPDIPPINAIVATGETGILVSRDDRPAYSEAVLRLLDDKSLRAACGARGRDRVRRHFDSRAQYSQIEATYRRLREQVVQA